MNDSNTVEQKANETAPNRPIYERVGMTQEFAEEVATKLILTSVPIRKPNKTEFIQVHPERELSVATLKLKDEFEEWVIDADIAKHVPEHIVVKTVVHAVNTKGISFLWPLKVSTKDGKTLDHWSETALIASKEARGKWIKVMSDPALGGYRCSMALGDLPEPKWPAESWEEVMNIAFRERFIDSPDHQVIRRLRGLEI